MPDGWLPHEMPAPRWRMVGWALFGEAVARQSCPMSVVRRPPFPTTLLALDRREGSAHPVRVALRVRDDPLSALSAEDPPQLGIPLLQPGPVGQDGFKGPLLSGKAASLFVNWRPGAVGLPAADSQVGNDGGHRPSGRLLLSSHPFGHLGRDPDLDLLSGRCRSRHPPASS